MEAKLIRVVRDAAGQVLLKWIEAPVANICDECGEPIASGDTMARYIEICPGDWGQSRVRIGRDYCKSCGELLEDSLTTTE